MGVLEYLVFILEVVLLVILVVEFGVISDVVSLLLFSGLFILVEVFLLSWYVVVVCGLVA